MAVTDLDLAISQKQCEEGLMDFSLIDELFEINDINQMFTFLSIFVYVCTVSKGHLYSLVD